MRLSDYINSLSDTEKAEYAKRCGTTFHYLDVHIRRATKECRKPLRDALARESEGKVSITEVLQHFGIIPEQAA